ncbi:TPA: pneumococcal-type histidine triad protein [Streptococcus agalactiae]
MKGQKIIALAGLVLSCHFALTACHTQEHKNSHHIKTKQVAKKKANKKKVSVKESHKKRKGVAGVDFPTDDGFLLTKDSKILSHTDSGIVVAHGNHSHFIFYSDLKGSKFSYLIPNANAKTNKKQAVRNFKAGAVAVNTLNDGYVFNPADIVSEDANGYVVRHGDHFHYIPKASLSQQKQVQASRAVSRLGNQNNSHYRVNSSKIAGLHHPTSDGFLFNGQGIKGTTPTGILVEHHNHLHFISFADLRKGGWGSIADRYQPQKKVDSKKQSPSSKKPRTENTLPKDIKDKLAYLARELHLDISRIRVLKTLNGEIGFEYPHDDHSHTIASKDIEIGKPIPDGHHDHSHAKDKVGMATLKQIGFDDEIIQDILHADAPTPFPSNETNPEKMRQWLATVTKINIGQRTNPFQRFGLSLMPNIEVLGIGFTPINDMTPVLQFKKLKQLWMTNTGITDYSFLDKMPLLEGLDISQNGIKDLSFLTKYKQLSLIAAANNGITSLKPLAELPNLQFLVLSHNNISDLTPLSNLTKLQELHLDHNNVKNLSALSGKKDLKVLDLSNNKSADLSTLKTTSLETLLLNETNTSNLSFLKQNPKVSNLTINNAKLASLDGVEESDEIVKVEAEGNQIKSLVLKNKQGSLKFLNVTNNQLTSLEGVNNYTSLETLSVSKNKLESLDIKTPNKTVTNLDFSHNNVPTSQLKLNEKNIPEAVAKNFPAVVEGSMVGNGSLAEKAAMASKEDKQVSDNTNHQKNTEKSAQANADSKKENPKTHDEHHDHEETDHAHVGHHHH